MERINRLKEFLAATPDDSFLLHALALEYVKQGDDNTARQFFEKILRQEPGYLGSYYHLGKLLERAGDFEFAILTYKKGMEEAKKVADRHSLNELNGALEDITD